MDENKCKDCKHTIFDPRWGEYKCDIFKHVIYDQGKYANCQYYEKRVDEELRIGGRICEY